MNLVDFANNLKIVAYKDYKFMSRVGEYTLMLNPDKMTESMSVVYSKRQASASAKSPLEYRKTPPSTLKFDVIIDGTGMVDMKKTDVGAQITELKKLVYDYNNDAHGPNFLELQWGTIKVFKCRLTSLKINYTRFRLNGEPLRANLSMEFKEIQKPKSEKQRSPDMTKTVEVKAGESLPLLTYQQYEDQHHLLKVASFNKVNNLLNIEPGTFLYFPPLNDQLNVNN